jgi:hypothetical protein
MSRIEIRSLGVAVGSAVVEVFDEQQNVQRGMLTHEPLLFDVPEGSYLVQMSWADGERSRHVVDVSGAGVTLELERPDESPAPSPEPGERPHPPSAAAPYPLRPVVHLQQLLGRGLRRVVGRHDEPLPPGHGDRSEAQPTFALWRRREGVWEQQALGGPIAVEKGLEFDLQLDDALHLFETKFEMETGSVSQFASLPAERSVVTVQRAEGGAAPGSGWQVDARTGDHDVESLRALVHEGRLDLARVMAPEVMAERFLQSKVAAPRIAALGAYVLLRLGDLDRMHDWPDNLTNWMGWLPDGPVIAAWQRLRSEDPDYDQIRSLLVEAARRGLPVYSEGVRLLKDGLELFAADEERDWDVGEALDEVNRYARALVWEKSETTYFGQSPDEPLSSRGA